MERKHNKKLTGNARALRKNMTSEERKLWYEFLRTYPSKIYKQKILGKYIVDFYCAEAKLVIEVDGRQHYEEKGKSNDAERDEFLKKYGLKILRISNRKINQNFKEVCEYIDLLIKNIYENDNTASPVQGEVSPEGDGEVVLKY